MIRRIKRDTSLLVGADMGTGKTLVAVEMFRSLKAPPRILVIAPVNVHNQWIETAGEQFPSLAGSPYLRKVGTLKTDPEGWKAILAKTPGVYVMGWEAMRGDLPMEIRRKHTAKAKKNPDITVGAIREATKEGHIPPWNKAGTWDLVVLDESHRIQNRHSLNKKVVTQIKAERKLAMSGTPSSTPEGLWSTLNWLWPRLYTSFTRWAEEYMVFEEKKIGRDQVIKEIVGEAIPGEAWRDIPNAVRVRLEDIGVHLPEVIERVVHVPMGSEQRRIYDELEGQALAWIDEQPYAMPLPITQRIRLRQASLGELKVIDTTKRKELWVLRRDVGKARVTVADSDDKEYTGRVLKVLQDDDGPTGVVLALFEYEAKEFVFRDKVTNFKIQAIREIIQDLPEDEPVLIFTHSSRWARRAAEELAKAKLGEVRAWTGELTPRQREELKAEFGKTVRVMIAVIPAVAEGIDGWQDVCRFEIWASKSETALLNEQAKARLHRPGQKSPVQRWLIHSEESIDDGIEERLNIRRSQMKAMYGDSKK
jgi:superfamily II DNA or RNA helicase